MGNVKKGGKGDKVLTKTIPIATIEGMEISWFEWSNGIIEHVARHRVSPDEVEDVAFDDEPWIRKGRGGTRYMLGYTAAGRYLFIVYVLKSRGIARVVTALDMDEKTKKLYRKRSK